MNEVGRQARRNAFLYCKFRDEQFALYDAFAKRSGMTMNTLLVVNALFYAEDGLTQSEICAVVHHSKQTVSLIVKKLVSEGNATLDASDADGRAKVVRLTSEGRAWAEGPVRHITCSEDVAMAMLAPEQQEALVELSRTFTQHLTQLVNADLATQNKEGETDGGVLRSGAQEA